DGDYVVVDLPEDAVGRSPVAAPAQADDEPRRIGVRGDRREYLGDALVDHRAQLLLAGGGGDGKRLPGIDRLDDAPRDAFGESDQDVLLVAEMLIHRGPGDACPTGDRGDGRALEAAPRHDLEGGLEDPVTAGIAVEERPLGAGSSWWSGRD